MIGMFIANLVTGFVVRGCLVAPLLAKSNNGKEVIVHPNLIYVTSVPLIFSDLTSFTLTFVPFLVGLWCIDIIKARENNKGSQTKKEKPLMKMETEGS